MFKEEASVRIATQDAVDVLMKKAFSWSSFNSNAFLTRSSSTWVLCSRVKTRSRPLPTCTALWWRWVTWCSRTTSPRPWPRCCCHSWPSPTALWNPAPLPATIYCRRCTRSRCQAGLSPSLAWTSDLGRDSAKDSGQQQGGSLTCAPCLLSECVSVAYVQVCASCRGLSF